MKSGPNGISKEVEFRAGHVVLHGTLTLPPQADAVVAFAHGSGSSRFSPRNQHVASVLNKQGIATLLFDLLTADEERIDAITAHLRFDIGLLAERLVAATAWLVQYEETRRFSIGYFGASTGAAAALVAAADLPRTVLAVVSRGGRPDLAAAALPLVQAPTLLIIGGNDEPVIQMNMAAQQEMKCLTRLEIVPGATHLFEEPGALDMVAGLAAHWFDQFLHAKHSGAAAVS